jgi:ketosteroid isomerase-like protein
MYSWLVGRAIRMTIDRLNSGDVPALLRMFHEDAHFVFPGRSSFAGDHRGKPAIEAWLERFVSLRPEFVVHDVTVAGPPWNMRVGMWFSDRIPIPDGGTYENEGMEHIRMRWGRVVEQHVYLDTERVSDLDARLDATGAAA